MSLKSDQSEILFSVFDRYIVYKLKMIVETHFRLLSYLNTVIDITKFKNHLLNSTIDTQS